MSYNLVDPTTGDLTRVAGNSNIVDTAIEIDSTWSSSKIYSTINSIGFKGDAPENANSATTPGVYLINRNDDAYPVRQGYLIVSKPRQDYNCILQEVYYFNANIIYSRGCWFNSWYDWQQLATMDKAFKYSGVIEATTTSGYIQTNNPLGVECNIICSKMYVSDSRPNGLSVTGQATYEKINIYVRNADGTIPPDGTNIKIAFILF